MTLTQVILIGFLCLGAGAFSGLLAARIPQLNKSLPLALAMVGSSLFFFVAMKVLLLNNLIIFTIPTKLPFGELMLYFDGLAAFYLLLISTLGIVLTIYSWGYLENLREKHNLGYLCFLYNLFLVTMILVVTAANSFWFLVAWEVMSLSSLLLVLAEHQRPEVRQAGFIYGVMTHLGTAFIFIAFLILFALTGSFDFITFQTIGPELNPNLANILFILVVIGFGTKAGVIPFHVWLPRAHPAAPTNISALMSGVMVKTALYGLMRFFFDFLPSAPPWWGVLLISIGIFSALLGAIYTIVQQDVKKLLAYSTVENMGLIFVGLGLTLYFISINLTNWASFALIATFFHAMTHAIFKSLLFMGAGAVLGAAHTKNMEKLGGLIHKMPVTAALMLVGVMNIVALPPFSGFMSKWLLFQVILGLSWHDLGFFSFIGGPILISLLALIGGLILASFVRLFGITFLGLPHSKEAHKAQEAPASLLVSMGLCAGFSLFLGVYPNKVLAGLTPIISSLIAGEQSFITPAATLLPLIVLALFILLLAMSLFLVRIIGGQTARRRTETWTCGISPQHTMEYTGAAFAEPLKIIFAGILLPQRLITRHFPENSYFSSGLSYQEKMKSVVEFYLYRPIMHIFYSFCASVRRLQTGNIHTYLTYIFVTLILVLLLAK